MYRIDDPSASHTLPTPEAALTEGYWTEGNPGTGTPATLERASWFNMIQEELRAIVVAGGLTPSKTTYNQVLAAIQSISQGMVDTYLGFVSYAIPTTLSRSDSGKFISASAVAMTLPLLSTWAPTTERGDGFTIFSSATPGNSTTLNVDTTGGTDHINLGGGVSLTSIVIPSGQSVRVTRISSNTWGCQGTAIGANIPLVIDAATGAPHAVQLGQVAASSVAQCQLTLTGGNLVLNRYRGTQVYSPGFGIVTIPGGGITLAPTGLTAATMYYMYLDPNGGTPRLVVSTTGHTTDATGVEVETGNNSLVLVGMGWALTATSWEGTVRSWANDPGVSSLVSFTSSASTASTGGFIEVASAFRNPFMIWAGELPTFSECGSVFNTTANAGIVSSIGIDGLIVTVDAGSSLAPPNANQNFPIAVSGGHPGLSEGRHFATTIGFVGTGTGSWVGGANVSQRFSLSVTIPPRK